MKQTLTHSVRIIALIALISTFGLYCFPGASKSWGQIISMTTTGSNAQDFNTLAMSGTGITWADNSTIPSWYASRTTYNAGTGSSNTGALYSFGSVSASDRALGSVNTNGTGAIAYGIQLQNNSGSAITDMTVAYTGEQWRKESNTTQDQILFYYKVFSSAETSVTNAVDGSWTAITSLTFNAPIASGASATALDGNAVANKIVFSAQAMTGLSIPDGQYVMFKWIDQNITGSDHGPSIDDVTVAWTAAPSSPPTITSLSGTSGCEGTSITITGTNFAGVVAADVEVGGVAVSSISSNSGTEIVAILGGAASGVVTVTNDAGTGTSDDSFTVYAAPGAPTVVNPTSPVSICAGQSIDFNATSPGNTINWYSQASGGTTVGSSASGGDFSYIVPSDNTYYAEAETAQGCKSLTRSATGAITLNNVPGNATTPSPTNSATGICYSGTGAVSSISWASVSGALSYDVYFGEGGTPPGSVTSNVGATSYSTGALAQNTQYSWKIVPKNACGDAIGASAWTFTTATTPCFCTPTYSNSGSGDFATQVSLETLLQNTASNPPPHYVNYTTTQNAIPDLGRMLSYNLNLVSSYDVNQYNGVWVDFNGDADFSATEFFTSNTNAGSNGSATVVISVPFDAVLGNVRMRVRAGDDVQPLSSQACGASSSNYGNAQDYVVNIVIPGPTLFTSPTSLAFENVPSGNTSAEMSFDLSAISLSPADGDITVTPPSNYEVSLTSGSGFSASSITVPYSGGELNSTPVFVRFKPTAPDTDYNGNIQCSGGGASTDNVAVSGNSLVLSYVLFDNFNRTDGNTVGVPTLVSSGGGSTAWTETQLLTEDFRARIEGNALRLAGCDVGESGSTGSTGSESVYFDVSDRYATNFSEAPGDLTWAFNMHTNNATPSGFGSNTYGIAMILGCDESDFRSANADGYAVVIGNSGSPDRVRLVYFTGGLTLNSHVFDITESTLANDLYFSVRVTYNSCTNLWSLEVRDDAGNFTDPTGGSYPPATTQTNSTHATKDLKYIGAFWQHSSSCGQYAEFDNLKIPTGLASGSTYTWNGGTSDFQTATNWTPTRTCPRIHDVLQFNSSSPASSDVTNVPTQTIGQLVITDNRNVTFHDGTAAGVNTLTIGGLSGTDLSVDAGSSLTFDVSSTNNPTDGVVVNVAAGATAVIAGNVTFFNGVSGAARPHGLFIADSNGAIVSSSGVITAIDLSGSPFGSTGSANVITFQSGSVYEAQDGSNPFALTQPLSKVVFDAGSTYRHKYLTIPSLAGRTYSHFEFDVPSNTVTVLTGSATGSWVADNVKILNGTLNITGNVNPINAKIR
ncbi:MAG: hypothetical protein IT223_04360, partial [Crocinitomicaceae bacterium]|nr:hypothetical protein [Crocinitomicaceae bacterium]